MQYMPAQPLQDTDPALFPRRFPHLPTLLIALVIALLAVYGLTGHHGLLVAVGMIAALTFAYRVERAVRQPPQALSAGVSHTDGGSFTQTAAGSARAAGPAPSVFDGGINRV